MFTIPAVVFNCYKLILELFPLLSNLIQSHTKSHKLSSKKRTINNSINKIRNQ